MFCLTDKFRAISLAVLAVTLLILLLLLSELPDGKTHLYFFDVGQGDAALIVSPENHQILVDGGEDADVLESLSDVLPFFDRSLDLVVLSHPHLDHMGGLIEVLKRYSVDNVMITGVNYESSFHDEFLKNLEGVQIIWADSKSDLVIGNLEMDVIFPPEQLLFQEFENLNNSSIVFRARTASGSALFTGDIEEEAESYILENVVSDGLKSKVLKVAHHGSNSSSRMPFLKAVAPDIAVIQSGAGNGFGHPHTETLDKLKSLHVQEILRNDLEGMIEISW